MPSFTVPESIIPGKLFVPNEHNFFEIEETGLLNGEPCLVVRGDINRDYKAIQEVQIVSPDIFRLRTAAGWALSFWIKLSAITIAAGSGAHSDQIIFGVMGRSATNPVADSVISTSPSIPSLMPEMLWCVSASTNIPASPQGRISFTRQLTWRSAPGSGGTAIQWTGAIPLDTWTLVVVNVPAPHTTAPNGYVNLVNSAGSYGGSYFSAFDDILPKYFCIGSYSDDATMNGRDGLYRLGKIAFHNRLLTEEDVTSLYNTMTYGEDEDPGPTVSCTINKNNGQEDPTTDTEIVFSVRFSEAVTGFGIADVALSGTAGATTVGVSGVGALYTVFVSGMTTPGTVIADILPGTVTSYTGGTNAASSSTDNSVDWS